MFYSVFSLSSRILRNVDAKDSFCISLKVEEIKDKEYYQTVIRGNIMQQRTCSISYY